MRDHIIGYRGWSRHLLMGHLLGLAKADRPMQYARFEGELGRMPDQEIP